MTVAAPLAPIAVGNRLAPVERTLADHGADALVVTDPTNLRWLTGFTGSNGIGVVAAGRVVLVTDGRYGDQASRQIAAAGCAADVVVAPTGASLVTTVAHACAGHRRVAFESAHLTHQRFTELATALAPAELVATVGVVERGRRTKDHAELERIGRACAIADEALAIVAPTIAPGSTEVGIRNELERIMRELGAAGPSYETIVATGPVNAPLPHHRPTETAVEAGHTVVIDVGALVDGYHSDMTRTFVVGQPTALQQEVYDVVLAAQVAGVAAVRPGVRASDVDAVCRGIIDEAGFGRWFTHGTGHGVGLLIHEDPFLTRTGDLVLVEGDVVTVEPGVYRADLGGVRVEDLVEVTSSGCRVLTRTPKDAPCPPSPRTT